MDPMRKAKESYIETLLWSETLSVPEGEIFEHPDLGECEDGTPLDQVISAADLGPEIEDSIADDLDHFRQSCVEDLGIDPFRWFDPGQVAHDFCLSRNGHGAGFFDRSYYLETRGPNATVVKAELNGDLQRIAESFGTHGLDVYVKDGEVKVSEHS